MGIDVFEKELAGLIMAEAEFRSAEEAAAFEPPPFLLQEVTSNPRFTGASLADATREELIRYLPDCCMTLNLR